MANKYHQQTNREVTKMKHRTDSETLATPILTGLFALANAAAIVGVILLSLGVLVATPVHAQETVNIKIKDAEGEIADAMREAEQALAGLDNLDERISISFDDDDEYSSKPKLGVYLDNLDFEDAYKMRYPYCHGVLVDGIVDGGAADMAGIIEEDIIMYFDGKKVLYEDHLVRLIGTKKFGQSAMVVYFRDEAMDSTLVTFVAPPEKKDKKKHSDDVFVTSEDGSKKKKKKSVGFGGGGYTPVVIQDEFTDVVDLMTDLGLTQTPFQDWGLLLHGGRGEGNVGNGWFLGGFGNGGGLKSTVNVINPANNVQIERKIDFKMGMGGLTIKKRLALLNSVTLGAGIGLGGAGMTVNVTQTEGDFNWPGTAVSTIGEQLLTTANNTITISRAYAIAAPEAEVMLKLTDWMRLRASYGYVYGYSFRNGWTTSVNNQDLEAGRDTYELVGSPDTPLEASTISVGLWFGF